MFRDVFCGLSLPAKTLCLTFDDGPWTQTDELGAFLHSSSVPATFFVLGTYARRRPNTLKNLRALGHEVGNHAESHVRLTELPVGEAIAIVVSGQELIASILGECTFFRPPFGAWSAQLSAQANWTDELATCIGPVKWDISGKDWSYWDQELPVSECARRYLAKIEKVQRGIVLMHDGCDDPDQRPDQNKCLELTKALVPELSSRGYRFVALDKVPEIMAALAPGSSVR